MYDQLSPQLCLMSPVRPSGQPALSLPAIHASSSQTSKRSFIHLTDNLASLFAPNPNTPKLTDTLAFAPILALFLALQQTKVPPPV